MTGVGVRSEGVRLTAPGQEFPGHAGSACAEAEPRAAASPTTLTMPLLTLAIAAVNVLLSLAMMLASGSEEIRVLTAWGADVDSRIGAGQLGRLVVSAVLHTSFVLLAVNSVALLCVGSSVESRYGHARLLAIYLITAICGAAQSFLLGSASSAGAMGAIFGLGGALAVHRYGRLDGDTTQPHELQSLLLTLGANLGYGLFAAGIDVWAHGCGLIGVVLGFLLLRSPVRPTESDPTMDASKDSGSSPRAWTVTMPAARLQQAAKRPG